MKIDTALSCTLDRYLQGIESREGIALAFTPPLLRTFG